VGRGCVGLRQNSRTCSSPPAASAHASHPSKNASTSTSPAPTNPPGAPPGRRSSHATKHTSGANANASHARDRPKLAPGQRNELSVLDSQTRARVTRCRARAHRTVALSRKGRGGDDMKRRFQIRTGCGGPRRDLLELRQRPSAGRRQGERFLRSAAADQRGAWFDRAQFWLRPPA
jgi:hypothetical protein